MYDQNQIDEALNVISSTNNKDIIVLHCVTDYPAGSYKRSLGNKFDQTKIQCYHRLFGPY